MTLTHPGPSQADRLNPILKALSDFFPEAAPGWIVDVGSRDGHDAEYLRWYLDQEPRQVIAVEARRSAARAIRKAYPAFQVLEFAAAETSGMQVPMLEFTDDEFSGSSSLNLHRSRTHLGRSRMLEVTSGRLDENLPPGTIDVLKLDVEGHSLQALFGLERRMDDVLVAHVETETLDRAAWGEPATNAAVAYFMRAKGFHLLEVSYEWGPSIEDQLWVNANRAPAALDVDEPGIAR